MIDKLLLAIVIFADIVYIILSVIAFKRNMQIVGIFLLVITIVAILCTIYMFTIIKKIEDE